LSNQNVAYCFVEGSRVAAPMLIVESTMAVVDGTAGEQVRTQSGWKPMLIACVTPFVVVFGVTSTIVAFVTSVPPIAR
jgi:hypothetical protein